MAEATAYGLAFFGKCAEEAYEVHKAPGSMRVALMDNLHIFSTRAQEGKPLGRAIGLGGGIIVGVKSELFRS